jgi:hypothetical protein
VALFQLKSSSNEEMEFGIESAIWNGLIEYGKLAWANTKSNRHKSQIVQDNALKQFDDSWGSFEFLCRREDTKVTWSNYRDVRCGIG